MYPRGPIQNWKDSQITYKSSFTQSSTFDFVVLWHPFYLCVLGALGQRFVVWGTLQFSTSQSDRDILKRNHVDCFTHNNIDSRYFLSSLHKEEPLICSLISLIDNSTLSCGCKYFLWSSLVDDWQKFAVAKSGKKRGCKNVEVCGMVLLKYVDSPNPRQSSDEFQF